MVGREERIEYRDSEGNLLDEEQVQSLKDGGAVSFQTRYETRTRMIDANGNEIPIPQGWAPEHPDVQGQNPDTKGVQKEDGIGGNKSDGPVKASVEGDESKISKEAKPASDANAATV